MKFKIIIFIAYIISGFQLVLSNSLKDPDQNFLNDKDHNLPEQMNRTFFYFNKNILYRNLMDNDHHILYEKNNLNASFRFTAITEGTYINDADLKVDSEFYDTQILFTTLLNIAVALRYENWVYIFLSVQDRIYFGSDDENLNYFQDSGLQRTSRQNNFSTNLIYLKIQFSQNKDFETNLYIGRQFLPDVFLLEKNIQNYIYPDAIDGVRFTADSFNAGKFNFIVLDVLNLYQYWKETPSRYDQLPLSESDIIGNYKWDLLSLRTGILYTSPHLLPVEKNMQWVWYLNTLFTKYGPVITGVDRADGSGKFNDNDYIFHYGLGTSFQFMNFIFFLETCRSDGIDRKLPGIFGNLQDIAMNGFFSRGEILWSLPPNKNFKSVIDFSFIYSDGPIFNEHGNKTNYGFIASGDHDSGFILLNNFWGFRPYSLSLKNGFVNNQSFGFYHSSGALIFKAGYSIKFNEKIIIDLQTSFIFDTTLYNNSKNIFIASSTFPKFQNRYIGSENMISCLFALNTVLELYVIGDIFFPGELYQYYKNGILSDHVNNFYGIFGGIQVHY